MYAVSKNISHHYTQYSAYKCFSKERVKRELCTVNSRTILVEHGNIEKTPRFFTSICHKVDLLLFWILLHEFWV